MLIPSEVKTKYPRFAKYVGNDLPTVTKVPAIVRAFQTIGKIDSTMLKLAFSAKADSVLAVTPDAAMTDEAGRWKVCDFRIEFDGLVPVNKLLVTEVAVEAFEAGGGLFKTRSGIRVHLAGACVLMALVRWAASMTGGDSSDASSALFAKQMYGWNDYNNPPV